MGMFYDIVYYYKFNINILKISEPEDFLFNWLSNLKVLIPIVATLISLYLFKVLMNKKIIFKKNKSFAIIIMSSYILVLYYTGLNNENLFLFLYIILIGILVGFFNIYIENATSKYFVYIMLYLAILFVLAVIANKEYKDIMSPKNKDLYNIYLNKTINNEQFKEKLVFLGISSHYNIFFDKKYKRSLLIPKKNIQYIEKLFNENNVN